MNDFSFANHPFLALLFAVVVLAIVSAALELIKAWLRPKGGFFDDSGPGGRAA